ncbi:MAG: proprotein convertase P-domain-containing protein [Candidatus Kaiserbacteria bacterium]|nr:proprotein convertase P-domain-containing protein [Candidatus Kaiserbacteria bacterium]
MGKVMTIYASSPRTLGRPAAIGLVVFFIALSTTALSVVAQTVAAPTAPTLTQGAVTSRAVTVEWTAPPETVTSYEITWRAASDCTTGTPTTTTVAGDATSHTFAVLDHTTDYSFQIRGLNSAGKGALSNCLTATTAALDTNAGKPGAPTAVTIGTKTQSSFDLSWTAPTDVGSGAVATDVVYDVYWDTDSSCTDNKVYGRARTIETSYSVDSFRGGEGLEPNTQYWYAVRADNGGPTPSDWTACTQVTTERVLDTPVNLEDTSRTSETITLGWGLPNIFSQTKTERNNQIPDNGQSSRRLVSTINVPTRSTINAISVAVDITHTYIGDLVVELVSPDGTVTALHDRSGDGTDDIDQTYSSELSGLIGTESRGNWQLRVSDYSASDSGHLNSWTLTVGDTSRITAYEIDRFSTQKSCLDAGSTKGTGTPVTGIDPVGRTVTVTGLSAATTYWFRARSSDGTNFGAYTACVAAKTSQGLLPPTNLKSTAVTRDSVFLAWDLPGIFSEKKTEEKDISDNGRSQSTSSTINVPDSITIDSISVTVDIDHTYVGDLKIDLVTPRGTTIVLNDRTSGAQKNLKTTYTTANLPALVGLFDTNARGNWRLRVGDYRSEDTGRLNSWTLTIGDVASITDYDVEKFSSAASCQDTSTAGTQITDVTVNARTAVARNLDPGTTYWFRVRSTDGQGSSAYSACFSATTDTGVPTPTNVRSTSKTDESIDLTWDLPGIFSETKTVNVSIPDNGQAQSLISTINVPNALTIDDISVSVDISHPYISDLKVDLVTPGGTVIMLHDEGGSGQKNLKITFDTPLNGLVGTNAQGNWQLRVGDYQADDAGHLNSWTLTIGDISTITNYTVEMFTSEKSCTDDTATGTLITSVDVDSRTATVTGLTAQTTYWFRVRSTDNINISDNSRCVSIITGRGILTPKNFRSAGSTIDSVFLAWDLPGIFSETKIENAPIADDADRQSTVSTINVPDSIVIDAVSVSIDITHTFIGDLKVDLVAPNGTEYMLHNQTGSSRGNFTQTYTTQLQGLIGANAQGNWQLRVGDYESADQGHLNSWTLTIGDTSRVTGYQVEQFASQKTCSGTGSGILIEGVDVAARTATATNLAPGTTHWFRVRSTDGTVFSPYSSCVSATTGTGVLVPQNLRSTETTDQSVTLAWDLPSSFSRTNTDNSVITDSSGSQSVVSAISVPSSTTISDISLAVDIAHSRIGDLKVDLVAPDGTVIVLHDRTGADQVNLGTTYASQLAGLKGGNAQGNWQLRVGDYQSQNTGTLRSWTLNIVDASRITGYGLEQFSSAKSCNSDAIGTIINTVNAGSRTAHITGLTVGSELWFRIRSTDGTNNSPYSDCVAVSVGRTIKQPTNLRSTGVTDKTIDLAWGVSGIFTATQTENAAIADNTDTQSTVSTITVPAGTTINDMAVSVDITHTYVGDLVVDLVAPDGTVIVLHDKSGGEQDDLKTTYASQFASLRGGNASGQWQLRVGDYGSSDTGTLNAWTLTIGDSTAITGYNLEQFTSQSDCDGGVNGIAVTPINVDSQTATATGLSAGTSYWFRVSATDGEIVSEYSSCLSAATSKNVQQVTNVRSTGSDETTVSLAWDISGSFSETKTENVAIADNTESQSVTSAITVPTGTSISSMSVSVDITHTYVGDLVVELIKPDGTSISLHDRAGASEDNLVRTFTSELADLIGTDAQGVWQLSVGDYGDRDTGVLNSWTMTIGGGSGTGYDIERFDSESACLSGTGGVNVSVDGTGGQSVTVTGLNPSTTYWFRVRASQNGADGPFSDCVSVATGKPPVIGSVTNLRSLTTTDSEVLLGWDVADVFSRTAVPNARIPDNSGQQDLTSTISVSENFNIQNISVAVDITHPHTRDLLVDLVIPRNKNGIRLHDREIIEDGNISTAYSDGILTPLIGISSQGDWTLRVGDYADADVGTLNAWTLTLGDTSWVVAYDLEQFTSRDLCNSGTETSDVIGENTEARTARITGLSPNTSYWFRVRAYNGNTWTPYTDCVEVATKSQGGETDDSKDSGKDGSDNTEGDADQDKDTDDEKPDPVTDDSPTQKPTAPRTVTLVDATNESIIITWSTPEDLGGAQEGDVTYEVAWDDDFSCINTNVVNRASVSANVAKIATFDGNPLRPDTEYFVSIRTNNGIAYSDWSLCSSVRTAEADPLRFDTDDDKKPDPVTDDSPTQKPTAPRTVTLVDATNESIIITWSTPEDLGGAQEGDVTYEVVWSDNVFRCVSSSEINRISATARAVKIATFDGSPLKPDTQYFVSVRTNNGIAYSDWSLCSSVRTDKSDSDDNTLRFDTDDDDKNDDPLTCMETPSVANVMLNIFGVRWSNKIAVSFWKPSVENSVCALTNSQVLMYADSNSCVSDLLGTNSLSVSTDQRPMFTGLSPDTTYWFKARWQNSAGWGPFPVSCTALKTAPAEVKTAPSAPRNLQGRVQLSNPAEVIFVQADAPETDGGSPITGYTLNVYKGVCGGQLITTRTGRQRSFSVRDLMKETTYCLEMTATNENGVSPAAQANVTTQGDAVPLAPIWHRPQNWSASSSTISVTWKQNARERLPILTYEWYRYSDEACTQDEYELPIPDQFGPSVTAHAMDLEPATEYFFKVRAKNKVGFGPFSSCQRASTRE